MASPQNFFIDLNGNNNQLLNWNRLTGLSTANILNNDDAVNKEYVDSLLTSLGQFRGAHDASGGGFPTALDIKKGDYWIVSVGGNITGLSPISTVSPGDVIYSKIDSPTLASDWFVIEGNKDLASTTTPGINYLAESADVVDEIAAFANNQDTITPALLALYLQNLGINTLSDKAGDGLTWNTDRFDVDLSTNSGLELTASDGTGELQIKGLQDYTVLSPIELANVGYDTTGNVTVSKSAILSDAFNGLTFDATAQAIKLGGTLTEDTTIDINSSDFTISSTGAINLSMTPTDGISSNSAIYLYSQAGSNLSGIELGANISGTGSIARLYSNSFQLELATDLAIFVDSSLNRRGILYTGFGETDANTPGAVDYSSLQFNSLVPKKYVDDAVTAGVTADNGLTKTGPNIQLGGDLLGSTLIQSDNVAVHELQIGSYLSPNRRVNLKVEGQGNTLSAADSAISENTTFTNNINTLSLYYYDGVADEINFLIDKTSGFTFTDSVNEIGARYAADYSTNNTGVNYNARWIPDLGYVETLINGGSYKQTVNLVANTPLTITHNLNEATPNVTCWYNNEIVGLSVVSTGVNSLTVEASANLTGVIVKITK